MTRTAPGTAAPEFSRLVPLARVGAEPFRQDIEASEAERAQLALRLDLIALDRLTATVELVRLAKEIFALHAAFEAEFVQSCVVTLDPVSGTAAEEFTLIYGPPEAEEEVGGSIEDDVAFEPLDGTAIDVGEAVAQQFALALPPFPRVPGASIEAEIEMPPTDESGTLAAALSRLPGRRRN
jgi:uncharacterized metal-binding protein YceD (DUF177 family)